MAHGSATIRPDPDAQREFRVRHGVLNPDIPVGNAQALIRAHAASRSRAVEKASLLPINNQATAALDLDELSGDLNGDTVLAAAVRGNAIVVIAEDPQSGRSYKTVLPANDSYVPPEESAAELEMRTVSDAELEFQAEISRMRREYDEELENIRSEASQHLSDAIAGLREEFVSTARARSDAGNEPGDEGWGGTTGEEKGGGAKTPQSVDSGDTGGNGPEAPPKAPKAPSRSRSTGSGRGTSRAPKGRGGK